MENTDCGVVLLPKSVERLGMSDFMVKVDQNVQAEPEPEDIDTKREELIKRIPHDVALLAYASAMDKCMKGKLKLVDRDHYRDGFYNGFLTAWAAIEEANKKQGA